MPKLVKFYTKRFLIGFIRHILIGFGVSALFTVIVVALDIGYQKELFGASDGIRLLIYLFFFNGLVFAGLSFGVQMTWREKARYFNRLGKYRKLKFQFIRPQKFFLIGILLFILSIQYFMNFVGFPYPDAPAHIHAKNHFHSNFSFLIFFASVAVTAAGLVWLLVLLGWTLVSPKQPLEGDQPDRS